MASIISHYSLAGLLGLMLVGCTSTGDEHVRGRLDALENTAAPVMPLPEGRAVRGNVGEEAAFEGDVALRVRVIGETTLVLLSVTGSDVATGWTVGFQQSLSEKQTRELVLGKPVELDGTHAMAWGELTRGVMRTVKRVKMLRHSDETISLFVDLGDVAFRHPEADVRLGAALHADFHGLLSLTCAVAETEAAGMNLLGDPMFSTDACRTAAERVGLEPLLSEKRF